MAMVAGRISRIICIPSTGTEDVERGGAVGNAIVGLQNFSISGRVSVTGGIGKRPPMMVVKASRASSGDRADKKQGEKRNKENIPSSPPPPSTSTKSVGVREENESIEKRPVSEAAVDYQLASGATSGKDGVTGSQISEEKGEIDSTSSSERADSLDELGKEISELRRERAAMGLQDSSSTNGFWRGVVEETSLIDWPVFAKVLGTTGVVVAMILGSSVVLLTVNAILAATSDVVFNEPTIRELVKPQ